MARIGDGFGGDEMMRAFATIEENIKMEREAEIHRTIIRKNLNLFAVMAAAAAVKVASNGNTAVTMLLFSCVTIMANRVIRAVVTEEAKQLCPGEATATIAASYFFFCLYFGLVVALMKPPLVAEWTIAGVFIALNLVIGFVSIS